MEAKAFQAAGAADAKALRPAGGRAAYLPKSKGTFIGMGMRGGGKKAGHNLDEILRAVGNHSCFWSPVIKLPL